MFKIIVIAILIFSVGCLNKKESSQSTKPKTEAEKAAANLKTTQTNLKEKMNAEEANYDSILSEIETMNTERRRLRSQTVKMRAELQKTSDKSSKDNYIIKIAGNQNTISKIDQKIEEKRVTASVAQQSEAVASLKYRLTQMDEESPYYDNHKKSVELAITKAENKSENLQNEKNIIERLNVLRKMLIEHIADTDNYNEEAIKGIEKEIKTLETKLKDVKKARSKSLAGESTDYSVGMDRAKKRASDAAKKLGKAISNSPSAGKDLAKGLTSQAWGFIKSSPEKFAKWKKGDKPNIDGLYSLKDLNLDDADALDRIQKESSKMLAELTELNKEIPVLREEKTKLVDGLAKNRAERKVISSKIAQEAKNQTEGYTKRIEKLKGRSLLIDLMVDTAVKKFNQLDKYDEGVQLSHQSASDMFSRLVHVENYFWTRDAVKARVNKLNAEYGSSSDTTKQETDELKKYIKDMMDLLVKYKEKIEKGKPHMSIAQKLFNFAYTREPASLKKAK